MPSTVTFASYEDQEEDDHQGFAIQRDVEAVHRHSRLAAMRSLQSRSSLNIRIRGEF
jgi:hypothetical protein